MRNLRRLRTLLFVAVFLLSLLLLSPATFAATVFTNARPVPRVTKQVDTAGNVTVLYGHIPHVGVTLNRSGGWRSP